MKKYIGLMLGLALMPDMMQARFYRTRGEKGLAQEEKNKKKTFCFCCRIAEKKIKKQSGYVRARKTTYPRQDLIFVISPAVIGREANPKAARFSSKNKFLKGERVIVQYGKDYVYGEVIGIEFGRGGRKTGVHDVKKSLANPFKYFRMKAERIGKLK